MVESELGRAVLTAVAGVVDEDVALMVVRLMLDSPMGSFPSSTLWERSQGA